MPQEDGSVEEGLNREYDTVPEASSQGVSETQEVPSQRISEIQDVPLQRVSETPETPEEPVRKPVRESLPRKAKSQYYENIRDLARKASEDKEATPLEPATLTMAMRRKDWPEWWRAMEDEYASHEKMGTWTPVPKVPPDANIVSSRWVYKRKLNSDGDPDRYKARLVARGFSQIENVDYFQTYWATLRKDNVRFLAAIAASLRWHLRAIDIKTAYLYGRLDEDIYLQLPQRLALNLDVVEDKSVVQLRKGLYGLKQSGRQWGIECKAGLEALGFKQLHSTPSMFQKGKGDNSCIVAVYVDDIFILGPRENVLDGVIDQLNKRWKLQKNAGVDGFLGLKIEDTNETIQISQRAAIADLLRRFNVTQEKRTTPMPSTALEKFNGTAPKKEIHEFRSAVGSLLWISGNTRPDIAFAVHTLSKHANNPGPEHHVALRHLLHYLNHTINYKLVYPKGGGNLDISGYTDASWIGSVDDKRKSTSGYVFYIGNCLVSWSSKLQGPIALSTAESEYIAASDAAREAKQSALIKSVFIFMHSPSRGSANIYIGSVSLYC